MGAFGQVAGLARANGPQQTGRPFRYGAFGELAALINHMERNIPPPIQVVYQIIALLPMAVANDRPSCLACLLYVLWPALRVGQVASWGRGFIQYWDDAAAGSSALQAALRRRLRDE